MDTVIDIMHTFDYSVLTELFENFRGGVGDKIWTLFSLLGNNGMLWITIAVILLFFRKTRRAGAAMLTALLIGAIFGNVVIKNLVMRPRPFVSHPELIPLLDPGDEWSFPSGHTLTGFAASAALYSFHIKSGSCAFVIAVLIAFSRLYACVHYPTDVIAGALIGVVCGMVSAWFADRLADKLHSIPLRKG